MAFGFFFVIFVIAVILYFVGRNYSKKRIENMLSGNDGILGRWQYTPEEWKKFSEDYFPWVYNKDAAGILSISLDTILISNREDELFLDLTYQYILSHIEYRDELSVFHLKLKKLKSSYEGVKTYYDGYTELQIPLPPGNAEKANHIVEQFNQDTRERSENLQSSASKDLVFAQFLNNQTDEDKSESEVDGKIINSSEN